MLHNQTATTTATDLLTKAGSEIELDDLFAQVKTLTGWTFDEIGELAPRQMVFLIPVFTHAAKGQRKTSVTAAY